MPNEVARSIDVVRGLSALGVVWGHSIYGFAMPIGFDGSFWVWVFLPISGYLAAKGFLSGRYELGWRGHVAFLRNRALRVIPLAEAALAIGLLVALIAPTEPLAGVWRQFVFMPPLNNMFLVGPLWTVAAEVQFYSIAIAPIALTAVLWRVGMAGRLAACAAWLPLTWGLWQAAIALGDNTASPRTLPGTLPMFLFGILCAMPERPPLRVPNAVRVGVVVLATLVGWWHYSYAVIDFWHWGSREDIPYGRGAVCALLIAATALLTAPRLPRKSALVAFAANGLAWCGFYTYGIYVWHAVLATVNNHVLQIPPGPVRLAWLLLALAIVPLSYRWIEGPMLRMKTAVRR